jgi:glycosyltransferase involved in cell wall biosynthesis
MDLVIGSSEHTIKVLKECKFQKADKNTNQVIGNIELTTKTEVLFEGLNLNTYKPVKSPLDLSNIRESFCYLFVGHWIQGDLGHDRKNIGLLIKSFCETFKNKPSPPALILKTSHGSISYVDKEKILTKIQNIKNTIKGKLPNIYLFYSESSDQEINELYNHPKIKAMISLTQGEGFGRPLLEFTQTKKPIITTGWSGHMDFLKPNMSILLPGTLGDMHPSARNSWFVEGAKWFDVDITILKKVLKDTHKKYKSYLPGSREQAKYSKLNFSLEKMKKRLNNIFNENIPSFPTEVKLNIPQNVQIPAKKNRQFKFKFT